MPSLTVLAPVGGMVTAMDDVPDQVFARSMVGPGVAITPGVTGATGVQGVLAPITGTVAVLYPHAFVVQEPGAQGRAVLVHLGIDTVELDGAGFTLHCAQGDEVRAGRPIVTWSPAEVSRGGRSAICPVVALDAAPEAVRTTVDVGTSVAAGEPLLSWG